MKRVILLLLTAGFFSTAYGQDKSLLYEVSGKELTQPSYLYGTFHLVCPADLKVTDATQKALTHSKQVYLEIDFDDPALQMNMMKAMLLGDGKSLKSLMKADDYAILDNYLQKHVGADLTKMGMLKPVALLSVMFVSMLKCQPSSYDMTFAQMAGKDGKEVLGLETVDDQMAALDKVPLEDQLKELVEMARKPDEAEKELTTIIAAYKAQDLPQLMKLMNESKFDSDTKRFEEELLVKRNNNWIPVIEKAAHAKPTFFAFGAGHLGGPSGVVTLLRQKGYTVKPLQ